MIDEVNTFMFEGHDTTSSGLLWTLHDLATHPDLMRKVVAEIDTAFDEAGHVNKMDYNAYMKLQQLHLFLNESHRVHPPVPGVARVTEVPTKIGKHTFPAGTIVGINPMMVHNNDKEWKDPEKFDPSRFLPENASKRHPYAYLPFSAGPRNCIGQKFAMLEEKVVLALLLRHFSIELEPGQNITPFAELVLRNAGPVNFRLTPRRRVVV